MDKVYVTWQAVDNFVDIVENFIKKEHPDVVGVYGIPRGGLTLGVLISHRLDIPLLMSPVGNCIIVDDICDSGESLIHYIKNSSSPCKPDYITVTMFYKDNELSVKPEFYWKNKKEDWIIFPWEGPLEVVQKANTTGKITVL